MLDIQGRRNMLISRHEGFTLIEMLTAVAVLAISMAFAAPAFQSWIANTQVRSAAQQITNAVQLAKSESLRRNALVKLTIDASNNWIVSCVIVSADCPAIIQQQKSGETKTARLVTQFSEGSNVAFNSLGQLAVPLSKSGPLFITIKNPDTRINAQIRIQISQTGNVRQCPKESASSTPITTPC